MQAQYRAGVRLGRRWGSCDATLPLVIAAEQVDAENAAVRLIHPSGVFQTPAGGFDLRQHLGGLAVLLIEGEELVTPLVRAHRMADR